MGNEYCPFVFLGKKIVMPVSIVLCTPLNNLIFVFLTSIAVSMWRVFFIPLKNHETCKPVV